MRPDDMLVHVHSRKLPCVLDPVLVLSAPYGFALALRLTQVVEPWLTRAFWQLIDASDWVMPQLARGREADTLQPQGEVLQAWIAMRDQTDAGSWPFRWIGDRFAESQLKDHADDAGLIARYEDLAESLVARATNMDCRGQRLWPVIWDPLQASLDTLALSAALDAAVVLTARSDDEAPWPVQALSQAGIVATWFDPVPPESLFAAERARLRDALAAAGLACLAQRLPPLAIVHVMANGRTASPTSATLHAEGREVPDAWSGAQAWWYAL